MQIIIPNTEQNFELKIAENTLILDCNKINGEFKRHISIQKGARVKYIDLQIGEGNSERNSETIIELAGENAEVELLGLFAGQGNDNLKISHKVIHAAPHTTSKLEARGILTDSAFAHQISSIAILPNQNGCAGDERSDTILLSDNARVIAVPELEIGNNDVTCKHAVTTTRLSPEKLFYLATRGLDEASSRKLLVEAHLNGLVEHIPEVLCTELALDFSNFT